MPQKKWGLLGGAAVPNGKNLHPSLLPQHVCLQIAFWRGGTVAQQFQVHERQKDFKIRFSNFIPYQHQLPPFYTMCKKNISFGRECLSSISRTQTSSVTKSSQNTGPKTKQPPITCQRGLICQSEVVRDG